MFKSFSQICEQAYLIDYGNNIDIETNKKVITHFKYIQNLNYKFIFFDISEIISNCFITSLKISSLLRINLFLPKFFLSLNPG